MPLRTGIDFKGEDIYLHEVFEIVKKTYLVEFGLRELVLINNEFLLEKLNAPSQDIY